MLNPTHKIALGLVMAMAVTLALFVLRPWSDYKPLAMNALFHPDQRVENFQHMDRIFPARRIPPSAAPFEFARAEQPLDIQYSVSGQSLGLDDALQRLKLTGLVVIKDDKIIYERYPQGTSAHSQFTSWSVAKSFVSTLVGMALGDGLIQSLDDPITQYVPTLKGSGYDGVPIRRILQMSSGVDFDETYAKRGSDINQFFMKVFLFGQTADRVTASHGRALLPGQVFHYISIDTHALGMLLRHLYRKPLTDLLQERIWQPLGMEGEAYWNLDSEDQHGVEIAFCCLNARLRDYAKLGRLYLNQGRWNGQQLLPESYVREATTPAGPAWEPEVSPYHYGPRGYGYQWWVPKDYQREYFAAGVWGQFVYVSEPDRLIIARTSVDPDYRANMGESIALFRAIRDAVK